MISKSGHTKRVRILGKLTRPYGLEIVPTSRHNKITKDGKVVYSFSSSPSCHFAVDNTLRDLVKLGLVPPECKHKIR